MSKRSLLICLTILCIISLVGCKKEDTKGTYKPLIKGLEWGMKESQAIDKLTDTDYERTEGENKVISYVELSNPIEKFGYDASVLLVFDKSVCESIEEEGVLSFIVLSYSDVQEENLMEGLQKELGSNYRESVIVPEVKNYIWESKMKMKDISEETFDNVCTFLTNMALETSESVLLPKLNDPVNKIVFSTIKADSATSLLITYYGEWEEIINYLNDNSK